MKLSEALEHFWFDKLIVFSNQTVKSYTWKFRKFIAFIGDPDIEDIKSEDIRRFFNTLYSQKISKRTIHDHWIVLSSLWTWAEKAMGIPHIIRGKIEKPKFRKRVIKPFIEDELRKLIDATKYEKEWTTRSGKQTRSRRPSALREKAIVLTLLDTGIRASELCDLRMEDYDSQRGRLHILHGKGDKERFVIMGKRTNEAISNYIASRDNTKLTSPLFASRTEEHLDRVNLLHLLYRLGDVASVKNVHPHRFRHTYAITFLRNGGKILVLKELLGHSELETVMNYVYIVEQDIETASIHSPADIWGL